jgi:hypothetical protein
MAENLIRTKQIKQAELSGFISNVLNTGIPIFIEATGANIVYSTGNQVISGNKTFYNTTTFSGDANFSASVSFSSGDINFNNNKIVNLVPELVNLTSNFTITGGYNSRILFVNRATAVTGSIVSGNVTGFNTSIIQVGAGQIQITGSGSNVTVSSYNDQFKTAGQFATITLLHTGNNKYIMYGNTTL